MSHFTVLAIGENTEKQLAPFQENNMSDCPKEYLVFHDTEDEMLKEYQEGVTEKILLVDGRMYDPWDNHFKVGDPERPFHSESVYPEGHIKVKMPFKNLYPTFKTFVEGWHGSKRRDPDKKRYGYWENPNAKWDWYTLGGRWTGFFKLKSDVVDAKIGRPGLGADVAPPGTADQAQKKDIDFEGMRNEVGQKAGQEHDRATLIIDGRSFESWEETLKRVGGGRDKIDQARKEYHGQDVLKDFAAAKIHFWDDGPGKYLVSREEFVRRARERAISTFAVIKDGKWYERGQMGWWGFVHDEKKPEEWNKQFAELLDGLSDDTWLSVYDCHI